MKIDSPYAITACFSLAIVCAVLALVVLGVRYPAPVVAVVCALLTVLAIAPNVHWLVLHATGAAPCEDWVDSPGRFFGLVFGLLPISGLASAIASMVGP